MITSTKPHATKKAEASSKRLNLLANSALEKAAQLWFLVTVIGQWIFMYYVAYVYGKPALQGKFEEWNKAMPHGYVSGETVGNIAVGMHVLLAIIIMVCGPLQLIPQIQKKVPVLHRWNGRMYLLAVVGTSLAGLYMIWTRGTVGGMVQYIGISLDAVLILIFSALALRTAIARKFTAHRRWALRLFLASSAVWFYRIGFMLWMILHNGQPVGFDPEKFEGPFVSTMAFAQYMLPLTIVEIYFLTQKRAEARGRLAMAAFLLVMTMVMAVGIYGATIGMWMPRLQ